METHKLPLPTPQPLTRSLGVAGVLFLTLSAATPASSVFVIVPGMLQVAGTGALWALLLAGLVCWATAYVYAELSSAWPIAGGEYVMVARTLGPGAGFVILGVNVFNNMLFLPVVALGVSDVLGTVLPGPARVPVALAVVIGATLVALLNIRVNAWVTGIFLAVELVALAALALLGFGDQVRSIAAMLARPEMVVGGALVPAGAVPIGLATTIAIFAFNGYGMAVYFGEEMTDAPRRIGGVVLIALLCTLVAEAGPVTAVLAGAPDLVALLTADDPFGVFTRLRGGVAAGGWIMLALVVAMINAAIVAILAGARFFYATGRDRVWGRRCDALMGAVHPRFGSPWAGTVMIGAIGCACCFVDLRFLLVLSGAGLVVTYAAISLAVMVGRHTGATGHGSYRMPWFPLAPAFTLVVLAGVGWANWLDIVEGRPGVIATGVQMAAAWLYWRLVLRKNGWVTRDPAVTD